MNASGTAAASCSSSAFGHLRDAALMHEHAVGEPSAADQPEHAVARLPGRDALSAASTVPATSSPGTSAGLAGRRGVAARALCEVGGVQAREVDPDHHVLRAGLGIRPLLEGHDFVSTRAVKTTALMP